MHCLTSHWKSVLDKGGLYYYLVTIVTIKIICAALFVIRGFVLQEKNDNGEDTFQIAKTPFDESKSYKKISSIFYSYTIFAFYRDAVGNAKKGGSKEKTGKHAGF